MQTWNHHRQPIACPAREELRAALPEYATALILGLPASASYPALAAHLARCAACRGEVAELCELIWPAYADEAAVEGDARRPDLAFRSTPATSR